MNKLSVVISAYNEEQIISTSLKSVKFADEIIVIDNSSTDKTAAISKAHKAKVFKRPNNPMLNINKNFGFSKASGDWILNLDADESVDTQLKKDIINILGKRRIHSMATGFRVKINYSEKKYCMRAGILIFKIGFLEKEKGFAEKHVHEHIQVDGEINTLTGHILHDSYRTISQFITKHDLYSSNEAENYIKDGYRLKKLDIIRFPKDEFISRFFARRGYKDGFHGLALSLLMAFYHLLIYLKIWEIRKFTKQAITVSEVEKEFNLSYDEMEHWFSQSSGKSERGWIKRKIRKLI